MSIEILAQQGIILYLLILVIAFLSLIFTRRLLKLSFPYIFTGIIGLILGLWLGSMLANTASNLPGNLGKWLPIIIQVFVTVGVLDLFVAQAKSISEFTNILTRKILDSAQKDKKSNNIFVDTSALIDARLEALAESGLLHDPLVIPRFILHEIQNIADSKDKLKNERGKRGMEVLLKLKNNPAIEIFITKDDIPKRSKVDDKIIQLSIDRGYRLLTVDSNLQRIAVIAGVKVINLNELSLALRPIYLPGEEVYVKVVQKGKEKKQGVGYSPDGTIIIIEDGEQYLGSEILCKVIRIYQTTSGKMIFVEPK